MSKKAKVSQTWLMIALSIAILARIGLWVSYLPAHGNDTSTYQHLANSLRNHQGFERYNGTRTPGYPFFLMITGTEEQAYLVQLCLGVITSLLVYWVTWRLSEKHWLAGLLSLAHSLNLGQLFFEAALLSEAVATFLFFAWLAGMVFLLNQNKQKTDRLHINRHWMTAFGVGITGVALIFTRPLFVFIPFLGAFFLLFFLHSPIKIRLGTTALVVLPAVISLAIWANFIHTRFNMWGMDTIGGYHLVTHVSSFFELAPDQYAPIRDIFLQFRDERIAATGSTANTIWDAIPALMQESRLNYYALSRLMGQISSELIASHPFLYMENLILGWVWFWKVGVFWLPDQVTNVSLRSILSAILLAERILTFGFNLLLLAGTMTLASSTWRKILGMNSSLYMAIGTIMAASLVQSLAEHGDNARYLAPQQTLVIIIVGLWIYNIFIHWKANHK